MTVAEYKKIMTDEFMRNETLAKAYGFSVGDEFEAVFSKVSIENLLLYIVAFCHFICGADVDAKKAEIANLVENNKYGTEDWWNNTIKAFQYGDELVKIDRTFGYETEDVTKQLVKHSATVPGAVIVVKVAGEQNGELVPIENTSAKPVVDKLQAYAEKIKPWPSTVVVLAANADKIKIEGDIYLDPLLFNLDGSLIVGGSRPVDDAINNFFKSQEFNGKFNKQKLVDAIQSVRGVTDVDSDTFKVFARYGEYGYKEVGRIYQSWAGWMRIDPDNLVKDTLTFKQETW